MRILMTLLVLAVVGIGGWQLLPSQENKNKTITVGTTDAVTDLDPAGAYDAGSWALFSNVFQSLLTFEPGGVEPVPDAAKSCAFQGSGLRTYQCILRSGITFPSGRAMTAEDVKYSFDRVKKINSDVGPASLFSTLTSVSADSATTVTFHLSSADATFPLKVATGAGSIVDKDTYPANSLRTGTTVDGTGPYTLTSYTKDQRAELAPNKRYQGYLSGTGRPVELRYYADSAKLDSAWKGKEIDVATRNLSPGVLSQLNPSDPNKRVTESDSAETRNLYLNTRADSPLHDVRVRRALAWLVNREELAATVYQGTVDPLYSLIPTGITGHTTSFFDDYPAQSVQKARELLTQAGVSLPVRFTLGYGKSRGASEEEAAALKQQLEAGGLFKVDVQGYEWTDFQKRWAAGKMDAWAVGWVADYPDPDTFGAALVGSGSTMSTGYSNKLVDHLILDSQQYADRSRAVNDFRNIQTDVAQDVPLIPLWQRKEYVVSTEDVGGSQYLDDGTGVFRLWRLQWI
ncbi:ABC transporter substrate-binding protein [Streptomyces roseochromogenus]|uniref:Peptide-binding protein n=1 Tax=Streptomyces roseochromogenus subsp. oscitans DS 12.976 TaxID=1352936 RepID=V6KRF0_STRRC|nr:ABC transporter substrate-binding protein [Streptomyces roseochromogenus]EST31584.1 peptide-binding protein [Streptomyces roseochromogenus subsp. oscitans DS 12.976]